MGRLAGFRAIAFGALVEVAKAGFRRAAQRLRQYGLLEYRARRGYRVDSENRVKQQ